MSKLVRTYSKYYLNEEFWAAALERVEQAPIYRKSHRGKKANEVAFLGELVIEG